MNGSADSSPRVHFVHLLLPARDWQDRPEFDRLCRWWRDGGLGVCGLVGIGGAGKTAIAERFLRGLPGLAAPGPQLETDPALPTPQGLFVFSFYDAPNPEVFFDALYEWLVRVFSLTDRRRVTEGGQRLQAPAPLVIEALNNLRAAGGRLLLVLDGIEKVQDDGSRGGTFGHIEDGGLRTLLLWAAGGWMPRCSVLVTTRFVPDDLEYEQERGSVPFYERIEVDQISDEACIALLRRRGVRGPDDALREVARQCGRHALTVDLAATYLVHFCAGNPHAPLEMPTAEELKRVAEKTRDRRLRYMVEQSERFAKLARRYHAALGRSDPAALALLGRICLFRLGVTADTLAAIFTGPDKTNISGPELADLPRDQLEGKLNLLVEMRLIERSPHPPQPVRDEDRSSIINNQSSISYTVHPAVRDGFLAALDPATARLGHEAARKGLEASLGERPGRNPSDPPTLDLLEEIVHHAIQAGRAQEAWDIYWNRIGAFGNLGWRLGAYERGERICRAFAAGRPPETAPLPDGLPEDRQALFVNEWAMYLKELGRLDAAAQCYQRGSELAVGQEDWSNASIGNGNVAEVWLLAGRLSAALRAADEALQLAERADDAEGRSSSHAYRAHACALRGETAAALADFRDALHWQHETDGETDLALYSNRGISRTLLLNRLGRSEEATRLTEANRSILCERFGPQHQDIPKCNLILADLARQQGDLPTAERFLQEAHAWALARDAKESLCWAELVRARIELKKGTGSEQGGRGPHENALPRGACPLFQRPEWVAAGRALEQGLRIARDCGFGIYHIDLLLERARWHLVAGHAEAAEADLRTALFDGHTPPPDAGLPTLLAATNPECRYAWGEAEGRHLLGETFLLKAAQKLRKSEFAPARLDQLPAAVRELIAQGRKELECSLELWRNLKDPESDAEINPHGQPTRRQLEQLSGGVLTVYPLEPVGPECDTRKGQEMEIITDPVLRSDALWSALEGAILALTDEPDILYTKEHTWAEGLNTTEINRLAKDAGLSQKVVFEAGDTQEFNVRMKRWLKVFHPDLEEPLKLTIWQRGFIAREPEARIGRLIAYLRVWQDRREEQLRRSGSTGSALTDKRSRAVSKRHLLLSYCRDNMQEVAQLCSDLIGAGEHVWWDQEILGGQDWKREIRKAMKQAYAVVACFSKQTDARQKSGIFPELLDAIKAYREYAPGSIFLIPVRLSKCSIPEIEISGTQTLDSLQYIDLFPPSKRTEGLQRLIKSLQEAPEHP